jgi:Metallo-peptidase family M12B Reprolysin-like/Secretion system C-terminal sorting domain
MKKQLLLVFTFLFMVYTSQSQTDKLWSAHKGGNLTLSKNVERLSFPSEFKLFDLNIEALRQNLTSAQDRFSSNKRAVLISLPNIDGKLEQYEVFEASNFEPALQAKYTDIRSYVGKSLTDAHAILRFSIAPQGIQTMVFRAGKETEFMEPYSQDAKTYAVYKSSREKGKLPFNCTTVDNVSAGNEILKQGTVLKSNNKVWKTMRLALSCTGEYGAAFGGVTGALAQMNATMTRVNGVLEKDLALHLNIIANNTAVIYIDAATDPYSIDTIGNDPINPTWNGELQTTLTTVIGNANYDIGHLFGNSGGGGNAGCIGCVCVNPTVALPNGKGSGYTSPGTGPASGDNFDIDYVAHEIGHQLGGNHTFSHGVENNAVNVEPGSGSTIMGYAGITGATDVQLHSDDYYHYRSILQIQTNLATKTCPVSTTLTNTPPTINAGLDWTIPKGTPFVLTGTGTDPNGDAITYCWEQNNDASIAAGSAGESLGNPGSFASPAKTNGPNFRSFKPLAIPVRYFPELSKVLANTLSTSFESVYTPATTNVNASFVLTGRDNAVGAYQTNTDGMVITTSGTVGPFDVTSQNAAGVSWTKGSTQTITWTVNGTTALVGSTNVDILLSTDGGLTFPTVLATATPNDGTEAITVPNIAAPYCRVMVKPTGNIYYDINPVSFAIGYTVTTTTTCTDYTRTFSPPRALATGWTRYGILGPTTPITDDYTISDVNVKVVCTAIATNQLSIGLVKPGSTTVDSVLFDGPTSGCDNTKTNLNVVFDDEATSPFDCNATNTGASYIGLNPLSSFDGLNSMGVWGLAAKSTDITNTMSSITLTLCKTESIIVLSNPEYEFADFSLFPNPNNGEFTLKLTSASSNDIKIIVDDVRGRSVFEKTYSNTGAFNQNISLNKVQAGVYLVSINDGTKKTVKRILIE